MMNTGLIISAIRRRIRRQLHLKAHKETGALRWGIIGLGNMAQVFADALNGNSGSVLVAVASRTKEKALRFAKRNGVENAYASYEEMLSDDSLNLDVIYIATPVNCHYEHIKLCLNAGKNVLCEKPVTEATSEFLELVALARERHCFFMEGMWMKCLPSFQQAKRWLNDGKIGNLNLIRADLYKREHIRENLTIFNAQLGGGVLRDFGVYAIAFAETFIGYPDEIVGQSLFSQYGVDADWQIYMRQGDIRAFINLSSGFGSASKAVLNGDCGSVEFDSQFNRTNTVSLYSKDGTLIETRKFHYSFDGFEYEINHVNNMIRSGCIESDTVTLNDTADVLRIIDRLNNVE